MATVVDSGMLSESQTEVPGGRIQRHAGIDRLFHWLTAASVLTLMATGLLPVLGVHFNWVVVHWSVGCLLIVLVVFHIVRSLIWQRFRTMWFSGAELARKRVGKYT